MTFQQYIYVLMACVVIAVISWAFDEIRILVRRIFGKKNR